MSIESKSTGDTFEALYQISQLLNSILDPDLLFERVMDEAIRATNAERGLLVLVAPKTGELEVRVARHIEAAIGKELSELSQTALRQVLETRIGRVYLDAPSAFPSSASIIIPRVRSIAAVPMIVRDRVVGGIYLDRRSDHGVFHEDTLRFLRAFANIAALAIENARLHQGLIAETSQLRAALREWRQFPEIVGQSPAMQRVYDLMNRVIPTDVPVLIHGETGTGKELVARAIHFNGPRGQAPFVPVNCSAIPEHLLESELFGHRKGSFTGAGTDKQGLLEAASSGTVFLDEIGDMPFALQPKLLRVLQDGEVRRVGDTASFHVDVRVISATHGDLPELIRTGDFREDLYYRLNVIPIDIPPLRQRREDIPALASHFLKSSAKRLRKPATGFTAQALQRLLEYDWPGNIRQLENVIERAVVLSSGDRITEADIMFPELGNMIARADASRAEIEKQLVLERLKQYGGNRTRTAASLGISRRTLQNWLRRWKHAERDIF
ncbi:MAG: sigma-54-dependent Fis family transcriptional regulator [candidate division WOR-3 bacterium]